MKIRVVIVDDKVEEAILVLESLKNQENEEVQFCVSIFSDKTFDSEMMMYDIYFLDISMELISGIDLAKDIEMKNPNANIIFISQREDLVFETFITNALYFVRKSHCDRDMNKALKKVINKIISRKKVYKYTGKGKTVNIPYEEIFYFESYHNHVYIYTQDKVYKERISLKKVVENVDEQYFLKPHASFLVNYEKIRAFERFSIKLVMNVEIPVSRASYKVAKEKYMHYLMQND